MEGVHLNKAKPKEFVAIIFKERLISRPFSTLRIVRLQTLDRLMGNALENEGREALLELIDWKPIYERTIHCVAGNNKDILFPYSQIPTLLFSGFSLFNCSVVQGVKKRMATPKSSCMKTGSKAHNYFTKFP